MTWHLYDAVVHWGLAVAFYLVIAGAVFIAVAWAVEGWRGRRQVRHAAEMFASDCEYVEVDVEEMWERGA